MDRKTEMEAVELGLTGVVNARRIAGIRLPGDGRLRGNGCSAPAPSAGPPRKICSGLSGIR